MQETKPLTRPQRSAMTFLSRVLGRDALLSEITPEVIEQARKSELAKTLSSQTLINYIGALRGLAGIRSDHHCRWDEVQANDCLTLFGLFEKHYRPRRLIGKSENTVRLYRTTVRKFSRYLNRAATLQDLNDELVSDYLDYLTTQQALHSVVKEYDQLLALWRFASRRKLVDSFPDLTRPIAPAPVPDAFTVEELKQLLAKAATWEGEYFGVPAALWWEAIIRVVYDTGERIGAVLKIEKQHFVDGWLVVPAVSRKCRRSGKRFKLGPRTSELLAKIKEIQSEKFLFAWPQCYAYFWTIFGKLLDSAGLPSDRRGKWHKIRRSVATYYEAAGGNATLLLGHSSRKVTEAYIDTRFVQTPQPCDLIDPI